MLDKLPKSFKFRKEKYSDKVMSKLLEIDCKECGAAFQDSQQLKHHEWTMHPQYTPTAFAFTHVTTSAATIPYPTGTTSNAVGGNGGGGNGNSQDGGGAGGNGAAYWAASYTETEEQ